MNGTSQVADHLEDRTDAIIGIWKASMLRNGDVPKAATLSHAEFVDHIPVLLDRMADRLRGEPADVGATGREHARLRWRQGFDVADVVRELAHLRSVLLRSTFAFAQEHDLSAETTQAAIEALSGVLDEAVSESVEQFQDEGRAAARAALAEVEARRAAEHEARAAAESEQAKLRAVLEHLPVGVWVVDASGMLVGMNREAERLQGVDGADLVDRLDIRTLVDSTRVLRPDGSAYAAGELPIIRALRGEETSQEEIHWEVAGRRRIVTINAAPLTGPGGAIVGALGVVQDITVRRALEDQLLGQLGFTAAVAESMGEGLYAVDRDGRLTFINPAAERMLGYSADELTGRNMHEVVHSRRPDGSPYPIAECPLYQMLGRGEGAHGDETFFRRDGAAFPVAFTMAPIRRDGSMLGAVMTFSDITGRKRLEAELAAALAQFRGIVDQSPVMIWRADAEGRRVFHNRTWLEYRGRDQGQEAGGGWLDGVHPDDRPACLEASLGAMARREPFQVSYRLLRCDHTYRMFIDHGSPYFDADGRFLGYLGSCLDVTDRSELERSLTQQKELAEEASRHKSRLLSALSHDARTPLNAVGLAAELLELNLKGHATAEVDECLATIRHSVRNVMDLLGDLLNLSRIDAGGAPVEPSRFDLEPTLAECLASVETQARQKGLGVRLEPGPLAGRALETDRAKLKQILCNLLSNALRYTDRGHIRLYGQRSDDQVRIAVEDTGVGIDPADQGRVFDEFARLQHAHRPVGEGTGLGLAICRRLANLLGGEITLSSAPGVGSTFTLVLPASLLRAGSSDEIPAVAATGAGSAPGGLILVAEDNLSSRQILARLLTRMGYRVREAGNGHDALALIRKERPRAVLMDINMPVMDGIDATIALRADPATADLPIFALTGDVTLVNQRRIGEAGVDGYLEKPVNLDALRRALASLAPRP